MKLLKNIRLLENEQLVEKEILFDEQQILRIADVIDEPHALSLIHIWHGIAPNDEQYEQAMKELGGVDGE